MGYTHYWTFNPIKRGDADKVDKAFKRAIRECSKVAKAFNDTAEPWERLSGYTAHVPVGRYGGIKINGKADESHEDFVIREHYKDNVGGDFCMTARKPYDVVVTACLAILKHRLKDYLSVGSDGDFEDWNAGTALARHVLGIKSIKNPLAIDGKPNIKLVV